LGTCPNCQQPLPDTATKFCPRCGKPLGASAAVASGTPWERGEGGRVAAFFETSKAVLFSPGEFFEAMPVTGGMGSPLVYGIIAGFLGAAVSALYNSLIQVFLGSSLLALGGHENRAPGVFSIFQGGIGLVFTVIFAPVFVVVGIFFLAGVHHVALLLLGAAREGFEATFRVVCYEQAVGLLAIVPLCGSLFSLVWYFVVLTVGFSRAHRIGTWTAFFAVLIPWVLVCCCCFGAIFGLAGMTGGLGALMKGLHSR
jgi:hypothetical protein